MNVHRNILAFILCLVLACALPATFAFAEGDASASSASSSSAESADDNAADDEDETDNDNLLDPTQRADNSFIYDTTIESLFDQASLYEGNTVQVVGEVVGDLIRAEDEGEGGRELYWIMLTSTDLENKSSISVLLTAEQAKQIDHFGRYGIIGTTLQVRGTYHQACTEHQGLPDIHSTNSSPIARGVEKPDEFSLKRLLPGFIAILLGGILMGIYYFARERSR